MNSIVFVRSTLPVLNAEQAYTLIAQVIGQARSKEAKGFGKAPEGVHKGLVRLEGKYAVFVVAVEARQRENDVDPEEARLADVEVDNAWRATERFLSAILESGTTHPQFAAALATRRVLFPTGLRFLNAAYLEEWAESEKRLKLIDTDDLEKPLLKAGFTPFVDRLRLTHTRYGEVLNVTAAGVPSSAPKLRDSMLAALEAFRYYVAQVVASADPEEIETVRRAEFLLFPLTNWDGSKRSTSEPETPAVEPAAPGSDVPKT